MNRDLRQGNRSTNFAFGVRAPLALLSLVAAATLASCGSSGDQAPPGSQAASGAGAGQSCVGPRSDPAAAKIAWSRLRNPILAYPTTAAKDEALHLLGGRWHMLFSSVTDDPVHWRIAAATSQDLSTWSGPAVWSDQPGTEGVASPDIVRQPSGSYVVTYTSIPGEVGGEAKIYYRTSPDLVEFSAPRRLLGNLHTKPEERLIDPALAYTGHGVIIGYKVGPKDGPQAFEIAYSPTGSLDGPWQPVGRPDIRVYGDTIENYQFLVVDGTWRLLATSNQLDRPWLFTLAGPPQDPLSWLRWRGGHELQIPAERWNQAPGITGLDYEHDNSAYLCDARAVDGHFYLVYAGSDELTSFGGWGHAAIGIARSTDLVHWRVPPD